MSEIAVAKQRYSQRGRLETNSSIKELGIGANIDRPETIRTKKDVTHKTREFKKDQIITTDTVKITRSDIMLTPESILKHEQNIEAIMISLKPTLSSYFFKTISKDELKRFFNQTR